MTDIHIPPEVVEAAARAAHDLWRKQASIGDDIAEYEQWDDVSRFYKDELRAQATAAIRAALENWPGMRVVLNGLHPPRVTLPLPQENSDDQ